MIILQCWEGRYLENKTRNWARTVLNSPDIHLPSNVHHKRAIWLLHWPEEIQQLLSGGQYRGKMRVVRGWHGQCAKKKKTRKITQSQWWPIINDHIHWLKDFPGPISSTHSQDITRTLHRLHCSSTVSLESICSSSLQQTSAAKLERCVVTSSTSRGRQIIKDSSVLQKVPINVCTGQFSIAFRLFVFHCVSRKTERICNMWLYFSNHHNNAWSRRKRLPVYDIIGFFCADDTESVHSSIGRCKVGMLSWSPCKTSGWALTASQELAHAGDEG